MADLSREIAAFQAQKTRLIRDYGSSWVIFLGAEFQGNFESFERAAKFALDNFADRSFLIRHTTEPPLQLPFVESHT